MAMKKGISLLLILCLLLGCLGAAGAEEEFFDDEGSAAEETFSTDVPLVAYDHDRLTVGNPTKLTGRFFTDLWGNHTSDNDVRRLVTGYNLITWDAGNSLYRFDHSVVSGVVVGDDENGDRRYMISLYRDLFYSDGTRINAWDYAFSVLLQCSPVIRELGGTPADYSYLKGFEAYAQGEAPFLAGLRVADENTLVFVVKKEALPYFYELTRFSFSPYPIEAIAPGCRVTDDGNGACITNDEAHPGDSLWTAERLKSTILTPETGFLVHPSPASGPYTIESFDGTTAIFRVNPWYKGNENGTKPRIPTLTYTLADNADMVEKLGNGGFGLLNKVTLARTVGQGIALCVSQPQYTRETYPRTGLTSLYFMPDSAAIQSADVRRAIAYSFDKTAFVQDYMDFYGLEADGFYGLGQWMYQLAMGTMNYPIDSMKTSEAYQGKTDEELVAEWEAVNLNGLTRYEKDPEQAAAALDRAGWILNEAGNPFEAGKDKVRYRKNGDGTEPLTLRIACTEEEDLPDILNTALITPLTEAGIQASLVPSTTEALEEILLSGGNGEYDILYLGNNFSDVFDPVALFSTAPAGEAEADSLPAAYAVMLEKVLDMDRTEPSDILGYMRKWIDFQETFTELLPMIPVYMNVYFDFYARDLHDYRISDYASWADAVVPARMYAPGAASEEEVAEISEEYAVITGDGSAKDLNIFLKAHKAPEASDPTAGALAAFPKEIRDQIPAEYRTVNEFVTATLSDDYKNIADATLQFAFETAYPRGETVYLLFGRIDQDDHVDWMVKEGTVNRDGTVSVVLDENELAGLAGQTFALVAVSKK